MSSFTDDLVVVITGKARGLVGRGLVINTSRFRYEVGHLGSGEVIDVAPGACESDLCSRPWWAGLFLSNFGRTAKADFLHDALLLLYRHRYSRRRIDDIYREALGVLRLPAWRCWVHWAAVRVQAFLTGDR